MQFKKIRFWKAGIAFAMLSLFISCDKKPIGPTGPDPLPPAAPGTYLSFTDFRALQTGTSDITVPAGTKKIRGVVISNSANEAAGNYRLQDESGSGIYLYSVVGSPVYPINTVLEIDAAGVGILTYYNGDLELKSVPQAKVTIVGGALTVTPRPATIAQVIANKNLWASSLVKIINLTSITTGSTNGTGTNYTIADLTGSITVFVRVASGITVNTAGKSITGYVSIFNSSAEIGIRSAADITP